MPLETATYISDLDPTNPVGSSDLVSSLDDHVRLVKATLQTTFPGIAGAVTATHTELNFLDGVTGTTGTGKLVLDDAPTIADLTVTDSITLPATSVADAALSNNVPLKNAPNVFTVQQTIQRASGSPVLTLERTGSAVNAVIETKTTGGSVYFGNSNGSTFAIGASNNLTSSPWISVSATDFVVHGVSATDYARLSQQNPFTGTTQTVNANNANWFATNGTVGVKIQALSTDNTGLVGTQTNHALHFIVNNTSRASIDTSGVFRYGPYEIGYRDIPAYPGSGSIRGTVQVVSTNQIIGLPFATNSTFAYYNDSSSSITITPTAGLTLRLAGTNLTGARTLAAHGWATVWFLSENEAIISGPGLS